MRTARSSQSWDPDDRFLNGRFYFSNKWEMISHWWQIVAIFWACWWQKGFLLVVFFQQCLCGIIICPPNPDSSRFPQVYLIRTHSGSPFSLIHNESKSHWILSWLVDVIWAMMVFFSPFQSVLDDSHKTATYQWLPYSDVSTKCSEI